jgi:hypothetical protein
MADPALMNVAVKADAWVESEVKKAITITHLAHLPMYVVLAAVLVFSGYFIHHTIAANDAALEKADARFALVVQQEANDRKEWEASAKQQVANAAQVQVIEHTITVRDQATSTQVQAVTTDKPVAAVIEDVKTHANVDTTAEVDGTIGVQKQDVQRALATAMSYDSLKLDFADQKKQLDLTGTSLSLAQGDLASCKTDLTTSNKAVADYRKIANKSKWRKAGDTVVKVALFAGGVYLGHKF